MKYRPLLSLAGVIAGGDTGLLPAHNHAHGLRVRHLGLAGTRERDPPVIWRNKDRIE